MFSQHRCTLHKKSVARFTYTLQPSRVPSVRPTLSARPSPLPTFEPSNAASGCPPIDFDDIIIPSRGSTSIPTTYRGFEWVNMIVARGNLVPNSGYFQGTISSPNLAVVFLTGAMESMTPFSVVSLHVTPAWNKDMVLRIEAFRGDTLVGEFVDTLGHPIDDYPSSSFISLEEFSKNNPAQDFADINRLTIEATGGTDAGLAWSSTYLAVDNIVVC